MRILTEQEMEKFIDECEKEYSDKLNIEMIKCLTEILQDERS